MKYYNPSTKGFYDSDIHKEIPEGSILITDERYDELYSAQAMGHGLVEDGNGGIDINYLGVEHYRNVACDRLKRALHSYVFDNRGYPLPTQATMSSVVSDDEETEETRQKAKSVLSWIKNVVLSYYYTTKALIESSETPEAVEYDFAVCDESDPCVSLKEILTQ